jgi:hypothetical protein
MYWLFVYKTNRKQKQWQIDIGLEATLLGTPPQEVNGPLRLVVLAARLCRHQQTLFFLMQVLALLRLH